MRKLIDPVHFYDAKGRPISSYEQMEKRIAMLERQNERLLRALRGQIERNGPAPPEDTPTIH